MLKAILSQASNERKVQRLDTAHLKSPLYGEGIVQTTNEALMIAQSVAKAIVVRKSLGPKRPCGFDSRPRHK